MNVRRLSMLFLAATFALAGVPQLAGADGSCCGPVTADGRRLLEILDGMNVEALWLAHEHVNWETGEPDKVADYAGPAQSTHCSAFAAAVGKRLVVYMLRPPDHGQVLLSNAQADWFAAAGGKGAGWREVSTAREAQQFANRGLLVVMVYQSPDPHRPGHIAIVRPAERPERLLEENGPEITQAGTKNYAKTSAKVGFLHHPGAWPGGVRYYAHPVQLS